MARLIDGSFLEDRCKRQMSDEWNKKAAPSSWADAYEQFLTDIENCPTVDMTEVRHGRWIKARGSWATPGGDPVWECSECGKGRHCFGVEHGTYGSDIADGQWVSCPNCGARMDGGDE